MKGSQSLDLPNHESLLNLARHDPAAYEVMRQELTQSFSAAFLRDSRCGGV